jgi:hypothetical protein
VSALLAVTLGGCSAPVSTAQTPPSTAPAASPTAVPSPSAPPSPAESVLPRPDQVEPQAVMVDLNVGLGMDTISLVRLDGSLSSEVTSNRRSPIVVAGGHSVELPYVSTSLTTLYFLRGDSEVDKIGAGDTSSVVTSLPVLRGQEAAFAVSPDDSRIAISVLDFNRDPVHVSLYAGSLAAADRKLISSPTPTTSGRSRGTRGCWCLPGARVPIRKTWNAARGRRTRIRRSATTWSTLTAPTARS